MTQYKNEVIRHAMLLEAEEWSKLVDWIHVHKLDSMWYDEWPKDTKKYSVCDTKYNDGTIERKQNGKVIQYEISSQHTLFLIFFQQSFNVSNSSQIFLKVIFSDCLRVIIEFYGEE